MLITISELLLKKKKLLIVEGLLLLLIPLLWTFGDKIIDTKAKTEISTILLLQIIATALILCLSLVIACFSIAGKTKEIINNIEHKRDLIVRWRKMVHDVNSAHDATKGNVSVSNLLERNTDFYSLRPNLSQETTRQIAKTTTFIYGSTIPTPLEFILNDIDRLEKEWRLI
jgi:hypothetical protein